MELLQQEGAEIAFADPLVSTLAIDGREYAAVALDDTSLPSYDVIVVLVRNPAWPVDTISASGVPTFDAVNALGVESEGLHERL
jgi:UDP-N-acetyl-D-mannosaminuronate dehydrogenase